MAAMIPKARGKVCTHKQCFDLLDDYILSVIFEMVRDSTDRLSVRLVCKRFLTVQASFRNKMQVLRTHILPTALERYTELKHLDLSLCLQVHNKDLSVVVGSFSGPRLQSLNLSCVSGFNEQGLMHVATQCTSLKCLDLSNGLLLEDEVLYAVARMTNLEHLKLAHCRTITDSGLIEVAKACSKLRLLNLKSCMRVGDASAMAIAEHCQLVEDLDLSYTEVTGIGVSRVALLKNLKHLTVVGCYSLDNNNRSWVGQSSGPFSGWNLRSLEVVGNELAFIGEGCLGKTLKELSLSKCTGVNDEAVYGVIKGCAKLERLDLTCCHFITDRTMCFIANFCRQLRSLKMESCGLVTEQGISLIGQRLFLLEELNLTDCEVNDQCLEKLANCTALKVLKLAYCTDITDVGLQHIGLACRDLREIDLYRSSELGDTSIEALANGCPNLSVINMSYCSKMTDDSLISISKLHELTSLEMRSLMKVTCDGLKVLASGCRKLEKLDMKRCLAVMDWGIKALAKSCLNLHHICLSYCWMISDEGLEAIAASKHMQNMSLLHLDEVTIRGLEQAVLSSEKLQKVKISAHLREKFSEQTILTLGERGCRIKWLEKPSLDHELMYPSL
ncbi:hypothetical protein Mapa_012871 [Marchantia paleacea]|nr:hypothetical protein Mapa_012871 [Marchantia paleacea]